MSAVTVLGLGAMGSGTVANLIDAGHDVTVWTRSNHDAARRARALAEDRGAVVAATARQAAAASPFVMSIVTDDVASRQVWLDPSHGALDALAPGAIVIESSTITPAWALELERTVSGRGRGRGLRMLEAPMVGSRPQLAARALRYLVGGDGDTFAECAAVLAASASSSHHLGSVGNAATMKLVVNALLATQVAVTGELLRVIAGSSLEDGAAIELLGDLPVASAALQRALQSIGDPSPLTNFPIDLVAKDLRYLGQTADALGVRVPVVEKVAAVYAHAVAAGLAGADINAIVAAAPGEPVSGDVYG